MHPHRNPAVFELSAAGHRTPEEDDLLNAISKLALQSFDKSLSQITDLLDGSARIFYATVQPTQGGGPTFAGAVLAEIRPEDHEGCILGIAVLEDYRREGVGDFLISAIRTAAGGRGAHLSIKLPTDYTLPDAAKGLIEDHKISIAA